VVTGMGLRANIAQTNSWGNKLGSDNLTANRQEENFRICNNDVTEGGMAFHKIFLHAQPRQNIFFSLSHGNMETKTKESDGYARTHNSQLTAKNRIKIPAIYPRLYQIFQAISYIFTYSTSVPG
jgi:hypothetical protein